MRLSRTAPALSQILGHPPLQGFSLGNSMRVLSGASGVLGWLCMCMPRSLSVGKLRHRAPARGTNAPAPLFEGELKEHFPRGVSSFPSEACAKVKVRKKVVFKVIWLALVNSLPSTARSEGTLRSPKPVWWESAGWFSATFSCVRMHTGETAAKRSPSAILSSSRPSCFENAEFVERFERRVNLFACLLKYMSF